MGTDRFGNDHFAAITGYGDYVQGNLTICHVYYVEGLGHNLFLAPEFLWVEAIAAACFTQNRSIVYTRYNKTPYELIREDQVVTKPNSSVLNEVADEFVQEDVAYFDGPMFHNAPQTPKFDVAESSSTYQDPSNMHQFHQ
ncbi:hypothetical protein Tco_0537439 [Tanacetum coccineum]